MKSQSKIRNAALVAALTAVGATAWAASEYVELQDETTLAQRELISEPPGTPAFESDLLASEPLVQEESLASNETVVVPDAAPPAPLAQRQPPLIIEERRLTPDERIQAEVMDKLASATNITGKIGVEAQDAVVTLSGYTLNGSQANRAGQYARSVEGVKYVQNEIRPQMSRW